LEIHVPDDQLDKSKTQKPMIFEMIPFTFTIISGRSGSLKALKFLSFFQAAQILWPSIAISGHVHQGVVETRTALGDVQPEHGRSLPQQPTVFLTPCPMLCHLYLAESMCEFKEYLDHPGTLRSVLGFLGPSHLNDFSGQTGGHKCVFVPTYNH